MLSSEWISPVAENSCLTSFDIVLMEKSGVVGRDAYAENADVGIFKNEMMMGFFRDGDGDRCLGV